METNYDPVKPFDLVKDQIRKGIQSGEIRDANPEYLSDLIFSLIHGAATMEIEFRFKSNILEPIGTLGNQNGLEEFRKLLLEAIQLILITNTVSQ